MRCHGPRRPWQAPHAALRWLCRRCARIVAGEQQLPLPGQLELFNTDNAKG
jgi:hypothetical protein